MKNGNKKDKRSPSVSKKQATIRTFDDVVRELNRLISPPSGVAIDTEWARSLCLNYCWALDHLKFVSDALTDDHVERNRFRLGTIGASTLLTAKQVVEDFLKPRWITESKNQKTRGQASEVSYQDLQIAAETLYQAVHAEYERVRLLAREERPGDIGAYARNGGTTSKLYKLREARIKEAQKACEQEDSEAEVTIIKTIINSLQNWIGQSLVYYRAHALPADYLVNFFGENVTAEELQKTRSFSLTKAKKSLFARAREAAAQSNFTLEASALSLLAAFYAKKENPC